VKDTYSVEVCCVGLGPAGIGAAFALAKSPVAKRTLCLDAGVSVDSRHCQILEDKSCESENPCKMISGVGGCSLVSSGKISGYPAGSGLVSVLGAEDLAKETLKKSLKTLRDFLPMTESNIECDPMVAKEKFQKLGFRYRYYPVYVFSHKDLAKAYKMILLRIESKGVSVLLNTKVTEIIQKNKHFRLTAVHEDREITIFARHVILAVGRFGQKLLKSLSTRTNITHKGYHLDIGIRLEFPTEMYPNIDECHKDLKLLFDNARTFCVCKGGKIAPYRYEDVFVLEGYYDPALRTRFTNVSIMVRLKPSQANEEIFKDMKARVLRISGGIPVRQMLPKFLGVGANSGYSASSISFWQWGDVNECFAPKISKKIRKAVNHFVSKLLPKNQWWQVSVFSPEVDYRLSFTIESDFSIIPGLYLIGDCTGRFRGILQAFCSGNICAEKIIGSCSHEEK